MSAAIEQQNNGDVVVEKVAVDAVKDDLKLQKATKEDSKAVVADNGIASKDEVHEDDGTPVKENIKGTKRPAEIKNSETKKAKKDKAPDSDSDDEEVIDEGDSDIESDEYDIPYDGGNIECTDDDDENDENDDDGSDSDDQA